MFKVICEKKTDCISYLCPRMWVAKDSLKQLFGEIMDEKVDEVKNLENIKKFLTNVVFITSMKFYKEEGYAIGYRSEKELFIDYDEKIIPKAVDYSVKFGLWRASPWYGGIVRHRGKAYVAGVQGKDENEVYEVVKKSIKEIFGIKWYMNIILQ